MLFLIIFNSLYFCYLLAAVIPPNTPPNRANKAIISVFGEITDLKITAEIIAIKTKYGNAPKIPINIPLPDIRLYKTLAVIKEPNDIKKYDK